MGPTPIIFIMTFKEARILKSKYPKSFTHNGNDAVIYIIPSDKRGFSKVLNHLYSYGSIPDTISALYAKGKNFNVVGIYKSISK